MAGLFASLDKTNDPCVPVLLLSSGPSRPGAFQCVGRLGDIKLSPL